MTRFARAVVVALVLHALMLAGAGAKESYCWTTLEQCIAQCDRYSVFTSGGCTMGCAIMYLNCD